MNGDARRRWELLHPEYALTQEQRELRKMKWKQIYSFAKSFVFSEMTLVSIVVIFIASKHTGMESFWIVFLGTMLNICIGMILAYRIGNKISRVMT